MEEGSGDDDRINEGRVNDMRDGYEESKKGRGVG